MAKQVVATMLLHHDGKKYQIDEVLDPKLFTKEQLTRLYERGAVKIVDESELKAKQAEYAAAFTEIVENKTKTDEEVAADKAKAEEEAAKKAAESAQTPAK